MELEFKLKQCTKVHFKCIIKREVVMFLLFRKKIKKQNADRRKFQKNLNRPPFHCQKYVDQKYF